MKTTLDIPDDLYRQAEARAEREHRDLADLVNEGLRVVLESVDAAASRASALAILEEVRRNPPYAAGQVQAMIEEADRLRKETWD